MIKLDSVIFRYPKSTKDALSNFSLDIPQGSFYALIGPNGAGKTTLLRLLCGRLGPFEGSIEIDPAIKNENGFLNAKTYGVLLENPGIYPKLTIEEYLKFFSYFYDLGKGAWLEGGTVYKRCMSFVNRLNLPSLDTRMDTLSLGNRQKVQILRAMLHNPKLLILDEPVANLDPISRETVWTLIDEWRAETKGTAIVCSHVLAEMDKCATDFAIINHGQVLKSGRVADLASDSSLFRVSVQNSAGASLEKIQDILKTALDAAKIEATVATVGMPLAQLYKKVIGNS